MNVSQHHAFEAPWLAFDQLVKSLQNKEKPYSPSDVQLAVHAIMIILYEHLREEIETLLPDRLKGVSEADMSYMEKVLKKEVEDKVNFFNDGPFLLVNGDVKTGAW